MRRIPSTVLASTLLAFATGCPRDLPSLPFPAGTSASVAQGWSDEPTHQGRLAYALDFSGMVGDHVLAADAGTVVHAHNECEEGDLACNNAQGNAVIVAHGAGEWTLYAHLDSVATNIAEGSLVCRGQLLGVMGNTGNSTGPHLHFHMQSSGDIGGTSIGFDGFEEGDIPRAGDTMTSQNRERTSCD